MKLLIWQWGRRGAGPRYAAWLAGALRDAGPENVVLSLSAQAEILRGGDPPVCELPFATYDGVAGFALQWLLASPRIRALAARVRDFRPDVALCAMPAPLDLLMAAALRQVGVPFAVVVHDADNHPGDGLPLQMTLQRMLMHRADALVTLSEHVATRLREQRRLGLRLPIRSHLPPFAFGPPPPPPRAHGGPLRLLSFGRLLPYKGLDLLADGLRRLGARADLEVRVVGSGPRSAELDALRALPGVTVENRWVPEEEVGALMAWADALILSHREASQSGAASAAIAAGRWVVATRVGGIVEQLRDTPLAHLCEPDPDSLAGAIRGLLDGGNALPALVPDTGGQWRRAALGLMRDLTPLTRVAVPDLAMTANR